MPSHFTLRMQFAPHQDPDLITRELLHLVRNAPVDEIMLFYFAEEYNDGHEPLERIKLWTERSRPYRDALEAEGVVFSLNPWHSLLHADRSRTLKPGQDWQTMVGLDGRVATAQVCPLDPAWQEYFEESLKLYAAENFRVIWIDDDVRFHNHAPLKWGGCFCPLHVAEFNRRAKADATREEIVAACTAPGKPHPWREIWMDTWQEPMVELISRWREVVEERGSRLGLMSSNAEAHAAEGRHWNDWWKAFGGDRPPIHRPHFWFYTGVRGDDLPDYIARLDQNRTLQPAGVEFGTECENGPYGIWNKPFAEIFAQFSLAHILGSTNLNISLYDFMGNRPSDEPQRVDFLRSVRPVCDWLADEFPMTLKSVGVGIPFSEDSGRLTRSAVSGDWSSLETNERGWPHWLGATGHAFQMRASDTVNALAGHGVWAFSDDELSRWLAKSVLIDGPAAAILVERGLGHLIGLEKASLITQADVLYSVERTTDAAFGLRDGACMSVNAGLVPGGYADRLLQGELLPGARAVSELRTPTMEPAGHGLVVFENSLGGRVAVVPWSARGNLLMSQQRAAQITKILAWLDPENAHGSAEGGAWLVPQFLSDGRNSRAVIWNACGDPVETLTVRLPASMRGLKTAVQFDIHGVKHDAAFDGSRLTLAEPLRQWEYVVLM